MRCVFSDLYFHLGLELTMWAEELLTWPSALLGGNCEGDRVPEVVPFDAGLSGRHPPREAVIRGDEAVAQDGFRSD